MMPLYLLVVGVATLLSAVGCVIPALICVAAGLLIAFIPELRAGLRKIRKPAVKPRSVAPVER